MEDMASSKRDKRRNTIGSKVRHLNDSFEQDRDAHYSAMLYSLQSQLFDLHTGTDPEYLERVADLEELRDNMLTELYLWEQYQTEQAKKQYEEDTAAAAAAYENMMNVVRDKLKARLENQRKRLAEDRALLNVSTDHSFFVSAANPTIPTSRSAAIAALSGQERRTLRRRDLNLNSDLSGVSGTETGGGANNGTGGGGRKRATIHNSDDSGQSGTNAGTDRGDYELLRDLDHSRSRNSTKAYNGVKPLKAEDGAADLALIAESVRHLKRRREQ